MTVFCRVGEYLKKAYLTRGHLWVIYGLKNKKGYIMHKTNVQLLKIIEWFMLEDSARVNNTLQSAIKELMTIRTDLNNQVNNRQPIRFDSINAIQKNLNLLNDSIKKMKLAELITKSK